MTTEAVRVAVDIVSFAIHQGTLEILLIKRKHDPFKGYWALPGGFLKDSDTTLETAAERKLLEETNVSNVYQEQLYTFGSVGRDPRGRVVTVAYLALLSRDDLELRASANASGVAWWPVNETPALAFDHSEIVSYAYKRLKYKVEYTPAAFELLADKFTLRDLQTIYEAILGRPIDNRNFRKKFLGSGVLVELEELSRETSFRPARLYAFSKADFEKLPDRPVFVF
jgi:8-oxo-dGTP diphosphatase